MIGLDGSRHAPCGHFRTQAQSAQDVHGSTMREIPDVGDREVWAAGHNDVDAGSGSDHRSGLGILRQDQSPRADLRFPDRDRDAQTLLPDEPMGIEHVQPDGIGYDQARRLAEPCLPGHGASGIVAMRHDSTTRHIRSMCRHRQRPHVIASLKAPGGPEYAPRSAHECTPLRVPASRNDASLDGYGIFIGLGRVARIWCLQATFDPTGPHQTDPHRTVDSVSCQHPSPTE
jgi:hypothetical protein